MNEPEREELLRLLDAAAAEEDRRYQKNFRQRCEDIRQWQEGISRGAAASGGDVSDYPMEKLLNYLRDTQECLVVAQGQLEKLTSKKERLQFGLEVGLFTDAHQIEEAKATLVRLEQDEIPNLQTAMSSAAADESIFNDTLEQCLAATSSQETTSTSSSGKRRASYQTREPMHLDYRGADTSPERGSGTSPERGSGTSPERGSSGAVALRWLHFGLVVAEDDNDDASTSSSSSSSTTTLPPSSPASSCLVQVWDETLHRGVYGRLPVEHCSAVGTTFLIFEADAQPRRFQVVATRDTENGSALVPMILSPETRAQSSVFVCNPPVMARPKTVAELGFYPSLFEEPFDLLYSQLLGQLSWREANGRHRAVCIANIRSFPPLSESSFLPLTICGAPKQTPPRSSFKTLTTTTTTNLDATPPPPPPFPLRFRVGRVVRVDLATRTCQVSLGNGHHVFLDTQGAVVQPKNLVLVWEGSCSSGSARRLVYDARTLMAIVLSPLEFPELTEGYTAVIPTAEGQYDANLLVTVHQFARIRVALEERAILCGVAESPSANEPTAWHLLVRGWNSSFADKKRKIQ